jgi:RNA polymerase sigma factor (sigma-70 family)
MVALVDRARQELARMATPDLDAVAQKCSTSSHVVTRSALERALEIAAMASTSSLDAPLTDATGSRSELIADPAQVAPWEQLEQTIDGQRLALALEALEPKERQMVEEVVIGGASFQSVATRLGLHRESVRKAHGRALSKLRQSLETVQVA